MATPPDRVRGPHLTVWGGYASAGCFRAPLYPPYLLLFTSYFPAQVLPGPADARATRLDESGLKGMVGTDAGLAVGCHGLLQTCDQMGNACVRGGAHVVLQEWRGVTLGRLEPALPLW